MEHGKCTKAKAIKALRECDGDAVTAIVKIQEWESWIIFSVSIEVFVKKS